MIGLGNPILHDDRAGICVAEKLEKIYRQDDRIDVMDSSWGGFRLLDLLSGYERAILIDAIQTGLRPPGTVRLHAPDEFIHSLRMVSFHDVNFPTVLEFARLMDIPMPKSISVYTIEADDTTKLSEQMSEPVQEGVKNCVHLIIEDIEAHRSVAHHS